MDQKSSDNKGDARNFYGSKIKIELKRRGPGRYDISVYAISKVLSNVVNLKQKSRQQAPKTFYETLRNVFIYRSAHGFKMKKTDQDALKTTWVTDWSDLSVPSDSLFS